MVLGYSNEPGAAAVASTSLVNYANHSLYPVCDSKPLFTWRIPTTTSSTSTGSTSLLQKGQILTSNPGYQGSLLYATNGNNAGEVLWAYFDWVVTFSQKT